MATGLAEDSGGDVGASCGRGSGLDAFSGFVSTDGAVVMAVIRQKKWPMRVGLFGFRKADRPLFKEMFLKPEKPGWVLWERKSLFTVKESAPPGNRFSSESEF